MAFLFIILTTLWFLGVILATADELGMVIAIMGLIDTGLVTDITFWHSTIRHSKTAFWLILITFILDDF
jgi:hypothetical protein